MSYFDEGMEAYGRGQPRSSCDLPEDSDAREDWLEGFDQAETYATDAEVIDNL